jgi:serine/threonine protein kinase
MDRERWARVRDLVEQAMTLPETDRLFFLRSQNEDTTLIADAEELLRYDRQASEIFSVLGTTRSLISEADLKLDGSYVGAYRVIEELGRGGMGVVYLAERADGVYQQEVAVKVLQENVFTPALAQRFRQERQILAGLTHPGIARLLDGGVLADGRPYLVLEFVDGVPIDRFCDEHGLDTRARLRLFLRVAEAVQAAHQQLVLHLDIKPANILVTAEGNPRLLDFGIARFLTDAESAGGKTEATVRLLTPRYASPEQASGKHLGVGSDVFSLATLLYRLLTGVLPYPLEAASPLEAAKIIMEVSPKPPSEAAPAGVRPQLAGDLDTILLQALRKEPERRYPTVEAFAADIARHLESKPVLAHADSFRYRAEKFVRRNRIAVVATAIAALVLVVSAAAIVRSAAAARRAQRVAEEQREVAQRRLQDVRGIAHSYIFDLDPKLEQIPGTVEVRGFVLQNGLKYLAAMSKENVAQDDDLLRELALGYMRVGQVQADPAMPSLNDRRGAWDSMSKGLALQRQLLARHPRDLKQLSMVARQLASMEYLAMTDGDVQKSYDYGMESWKTIQPLLKAGPDAPRFARLSAVAWDIANLYSGNGELWNFGDPAGALPWLDRMHEITTRFAAAKPENANSEVVFGDYQREALSRAQTLAQLGRNDEVRSLYEQALQASEAYQQKIEDKQSLKVVRASFADWALQQHDMATVNRLAPLLVLEEDDGKPHDRNLTATIADALCQSARIDFANGRTASGLARMGRSVAFFEQLYKEDAEDATNSSVMAADFYLFGQQKAVPHGRRQEMYERSIAIALHYARSHPEALSAEVLIGKNEVGLAELAPNIDEKKLHADRAAAALGTVVAVHPTNTEAVTFLSRAQARK